MFGQFLRPYASQGIVEHEFDTDHINIWVTFRFPMDTTVKPDNALWIPKVDGVTKTVTASAWQDEFRILLTIDSIASIPDRVTLTYDGPDQNLRITWQKQWEPFTDILSTDNALDPFGSFKGNNINWTQAAAQNVWYTISDPDIVVGQTNKTVFQNNQELKITVNGFYDIYYQISGESNVANKRMHTAIAVNGTNVPDGQIGRILATPNEEGSWSGGAILLLAVDDLVSVQIQTEDSGNPTLTVNHIGLKLHELV